MSKFADLLGTVVSYFKIGTNGVRLKNSSGNLLIRNSTDSADSSVTASTINISSDNFVINSDAANTSADRSITIARPTSGMSASYTLTLPTSVGSPNQVLTTDGTTGNLSWVNAGGSTTDKVSTDTTNLAFGSTSPVSMFTLPANSVIQAVRVIVDTAFNGTPSLSIGISGTTSKYVATNQVDLTTIAIYEIYPGLTANGSSESLITTYSAGSASVGAARIEVDYVIPA
ncbi:hypothetical protein NIES2100_05340 [Calothrix sp. NIES-2100]|uniref:hypothetical protein n=1 Tax=Calothrix sp. NIES-2100 TaxID=1954172 RepID=UPI000B5E30DB|nr:hypothetical protein NIES2100_05340 [Calothrix sp. NIES-2100]